MATATATITYDDPLSGGADNTQHSTFMYGTVAIQASAATYATGGLALTWSVGGWPKTTSQVPKDVKFYSVAGAGSTVGGFSYAWNKANNTFQIFAAGTVTAGTSAIGVEMTNGTAIPAGVSNDVIRFEARFLKSE